MTEYRESRGGMTPIRFHDDGTVTPPDPTFAFRGWPTIADLVHRAPTPKPEQR